MKKFIFAALVFSPLAQAAPVVQTWVNPECANGSCEVKAFRLYTQKFTATRMAGTQMAAEIETASPQALSKYAIVQYIQGCVFEIDQTGKTQMGFREFWGRQGQPFKHVGFELDSASDRDPIYWSNPLAGYDDLRGFEIPRNSFYANANPLVNENYGVWAGKITNLKENKIFVEDMPTASGWDADDQLKVSARNSSLKFKICLHKVEDVPSRVEKPATEIANAIVCMNWNSNLIYNFSTRKFDDKKDEIHQVCK
jgi:hypothetical protein